MRYRTNHNKNLNWGVKNLLAGLHELRLQSFEDRQRQNFPPEAALSRIVSSTILHSLAAVILSEHLALPDPIARQFAVQSSTVQILVDSDIATGRSSDSHTF